MAEDGAVLRAVRREDGEPLGSEPVVRVRRAGGPPLIEGSDSERTGTTWGLPTVDNWFRTVSLNEIYENGTPAKEALDQAQSDLQNELGQ